MALDGSYLDRSEFSALSIAPESMHAGAFIDPTNMWTDPLKTAKRDRWFLFIEENLKSETSKLNARLRKRYAAPFIDPVPAIVRGWLAKLLTPLLYLKRGVDPSDAQYVEAVALATAADKEITEAADSETGLFELPLRQDAETTPAISRGGPMVLTQQSPYALLDNEVCP